MSGSEMQTDQMICYCFNYRESDLLKDLERHDGRSIILQEIVAAKREGLVSVPASIRKEGDACLTFTVLWMPV